MAMNNVIDLDSKLSLTKNVRIADKDYSIEISDDVVKSLAYLSTIDMPYQMSDLERKVDLLEGNEDSEDLPTLEDYRKFADEETSQIRDAAIKALDGALGEGEGQRIYEHYNKSTNALVTIIDLLQEELDNIMKERIKTAKKHYQNKNNKK